TPRIRQTDYNPIDAAGAHDGRDVLNRADDAGIQHRRADACGIGIDEADNLNTELHPLIQLAREVHGCLAGADQKQTLTRPHLPARPPADDSPAPQTTN